MEFVLKEKSNMSDYLLKDKGLYQLKVNEMLVEFKYSENNKKLEECILNILKQKMEE